MSIQVNENETPGNAAPQASGPTPSASAGQAAKAPGFKDIFNIFSAPSALSQAANEYVELIQAELSKAGLAIKHKFLNDPILDVVTFYTEDESLHFFLTFQETYQNANLTVPPTEGIMGLVQQIAHNNGRLVDNLTVNPADYPNSKSMASHIERSFLGQMNNVAQSMNVNSFGGTQFSISTNIQQVRDYINSLNPQASAPRTDIGFVLYMAAPRPAGDINRPQQDKEWIPILAVGAYTKFVNIANSQYAGPIGSTQNHVPVVAITSISSNVLTDGMITMALPLAADAFIKREGWLAPYSKFGKDDPNLGSLICTEDDKPFFIETRNQLEEFRMRYLQAPYLSVDVTDGRARIPGLENFVYNAPAIQAGVSSFLNLPPEVTQEVQLVVSHTKEYIGLIQGDVDSRAVDYPMLVSNGVSDVGKIAKFLHQPNDPTVRPLQIMEMYDDYSPAFSNVNVILNAAFITAIANEISKVMNIRWDAAGAFVDNNVAGLIGGQGNNFQTFAPIGGHGYAAWNPGTINPFSRG